MLVLPIVGRELLLQARKPGTYGMRVASAVVAGFLMVWILLLGTGPV